jgi:hypothetical protein
MKRSSSRWTDYRSSGGRRTRWADHRLTIPSIVNRFREIGLFGVLFRSRLVIFSSDDDAAVIPVIPPPTTATSTSSSPSRWGRWAYADVATQYETGLTGSEDMRLSKHGRCPHHAAKAAVERAPLPLACRDSPRSCTAAPHAKELRRSKSPCVLILQRGTG